MWKEYAVLYYSGDPISILWESIVSQLTGIDTLFSDAQKAINWIMNNAQWTLFISMPLDESIRQSIWEKLSSYNQRCVAIEPAILRSWSEKIFNNSIPVTNWTIISILRDKAD